MSKRLLSALIYVFLVFCASACMTVSDRPKPKIDKQRLLESNIKLGMAYLSKDQRDNALRSFAKALEIDRSSAEAHHGMALIHQVNGEIDLAEKSFQKALNNRSDFSKSDIELSYARFLMEQKKYQQAFPFFESASKDLTYAGRANALYFLGRCADSMGDQARAMASYRHALNLNNRYAPAAIELADKTFQQGEYAEAKNYLDLFARNSQQSARSLWLGIRIERIFGNKDKEASYALALKNLHPYSREFLEYKESLAVRKK